MRPLRMIRRAPVLRRFLRQRKGVAAIEFALVITPFLLLVLGTLEIAIINLTRSSVGNAMEQASREVMTGSAGCVDAAIFKDSVCSRMAMANSATCERNLKVLMEELASFDSSPSSPAAFDDLSDTVTAGSGGSIMLLRTYYNWDVMFPFLDRALGGDDGRLILTNNLAFRNEPFEGNCT